VYQPLERFLSSLGLPFLARLSDSEVFLHAAESGLGIFELDPALSATERAQFMPIVEWADPEFKSRGDSKVIGLPRPSWFSNSRTG
jgi:hypothetical protein